MLSIIGMEARRASQPEVRNAYQGIRERIQAISLVHDRLYGLDSERRIELGDYLNDLISHLGEGLGEAPVRFGTSGEPVQLPMDFCLDIGLIVTELVINSYRHGTRAGTPLSVRVRLGFDGEALQLGVDDDGPEFLRTSSPSPPHQLVLRSYPA